MDPWGTPALTEYSCEDFPSNKVRSQINLTGRGRVKW